MIEKIIQFFKKQPPETIIENEDEDAQFHSYDLPRKNKNIETQVFQRTHENLIAINTDGTAMDGVAMDACSPSTSYKNGLGSYNLIPDQQLSYFAGHSFIGYQACALLAQHWLIDKAISMPAHDAVRNWFDVSIANKTDHEFSKKLKKFDKEFKLKSHCAEFLRKGRLFGIRIAMFKVESSDKDYYSKPFNIDGVKPKSYKGIVQIDPMWMSPQFDAVSIQDPSSLNFYEPTHWRINNTLVHRSHLVIMKNGSVPDALKPTYFYGGIPLPQKMAERVYAAERTANEAPMLAMSKRASVIKMDISNAIKDPRKFASRMQFHAEQQNNFNIKTINHNDEYQQFDTNLAALDETIMTQYQIVSAIAEVPAVKLMGTSPKGFGAMGEYEKSSYKEFLESLQEVYLTPLVERHHELLLRSEFGKKDIEIEISWNPVDAPTAKEEAEIKLIDAQTDLQLCQTGAIDGHDVRNRIITDKDSGYSGIDAELPMDLEDEQSSFTP
jgi:uncharacterized protein